MYTRQIMAGVNDVIDVQAVNCPLKRVQSGRIRRVTQWLRFLSLLRLGDNL